MNKHKPKNKAEEITIETLAMMINKGFLEMGKRIGGVDARVDSLESRLGSLESRLDSFETKMNFRFDGIQNQLDNIYLSYTPRREHEQLRNRVKKVERKVSIVNR